MRSAFALLALAGCMAPQPPAAPATPQRSAFGCSGAPDSAAVADSTPAKLEIKKLRESPEGAHLEVIAEAATAAQLATRLGQALGQPVLMADGLEAYRFTFYLPDVTAAELDTTLAARMGVRILKRDDMLVLQPPGGGTRFAPDLMPIESRLVRPEGKQTGDQLAALFCRSFASPSGSAQVIGDEVLVQDRRPYLDRFASIVKLVGR